MYNEVRHIYLTTNELPKEVPACTHTHDWDKDTEPRFGSFGQPPPGYADNYLELEAGLSCLMSDVQYALLILNTLCIAVFRTTSGRYGFFDPHLRSAKGLPLPLGSQAHGTAVMVHSHISVI